MLTPPPIEKRKRTDDDVDEEDENSAEEIISTPDRIETGLLTPIATPKLSTRLLPTNKWVSINDSPVPLVPATKSAFIFINKSPAIQEAEDFDEEARNTGLANTSDSENAEVEDSVTGLSVKNAFVTPAQVLEAALKLNNARTHPDFDGEEEVYNYVLGPDSQQTKKTKSFTRKQKRLQAAWSSVPMGMNSPPPYMEASEITSAISQQELASSNVEKPQSRKMVTPLQPSRIVKLFQNYPQPHEQYPEDFTLTELCARYPNHIAGDNLGSFLQHGWTASRILALMPNQDDVAEEDRIVRSTIEGRLRTLKSNLHKQSKFETFVKAPKTHREGSLDELEEQNSLDAERELEESQAFSYEQITDDTPDAKSYLCSTGKSVVAAHEGL